MNIKKIRFTSLAALAVLSGVAHANLVVNGGFETGDFTSWGLDPAGSGSLFGVAGGGGHSGEFFAYFGAVEFEHDEIFQSLATSAGISYDVSIWVLNGGQGDDSLQIWWEGFVVLDMTPVTTVEGSWEEVTLQVAATTNGSELRIGSYDVPSFNFIDDVSVEAVPEPGSIVAVSLGLGAFLLRRRKS
ncbi:MAG: PEP-CTERM sorting domain-containing protein [Fimbriimonadales bacterium]